MKRLKNLSKERHGDGIDLAEFMVDLTIKAQRFRIGLATCGGPIDILIITKDYSKFIKHKILQL